MPPRYLLGLNPQSHLRSERASSEHEMSADLNNLAERTPTFSSTYKLASKIKSDLTPVFSISSALFCTFSGLAFPLNPFIFCRLRTSRVDYRAWGVAPMLLSAPKSSLPDDGTSRAREGGSIIPPTEGRTKVEKRRRAAALHMGRIRSAGDWQRLRHELRRGLLVVCGNGVASQERDAWNRRVRHPQGERAGAC
jgi:hypothetical protein